MIQKFEKPEPLTITCPNPGCGHQYTPRTLNSHCPKCKNVLPLSERSKISEHIPPEQNCYRCGHTWQPTSPNIIRCPKCKSKRFNEKRGPPREIQYGVYHKIIKSRKTGEILYTFDAVYSKYNRRPTNMF